MARHDFHQSLVCEPDQRFAHRRTADVEFVGQIAFERLMARRIDVVENAPPDRFVRFADQRPPRRLAR